MADFEYQCGDEVKDIITNYKGIVVTQIRWFNGCIRYNVQSQKMDKDGSTPEALAFDEHQLVLVKRQKVKSRHPTIETVNLDENYAATGGPHKVERSPTRKITRLTTKSVLNELTRIGRKRTRK